MRAIKIAAFAAAALTLAGVAGVASAETPWELHHPRQDQVLDRTQNQQHRITKERREGELTAGQAHRLRVADRRIAREDHRFARMNGGYITKGQQRFLNHQENHVSRRIGA
jgi:hypothetical protein